MKTEKLIEDFDKQCEIERKILLEKNSDYADSDEDALKNFLAVEMLGICPADTGLLTRMTDKFKRLINLVNKYHVGRTPSVKTESVEDTIRDFRNYLFILQCHIKESWDRSECIIKDDKKE